MLCDRQYPCRCRIILLLAITQSLLAAAAPLAGVSLDDTGDSRLRARSPGQLGDGAVVRPRAARGQVVWEAPDGEIGVSLPKHVKPGQSAGQEPHPLSTFSEVYVPSNRHASSAQQTLPSAHPTVDSHTSSSLRISSDTHLSNQARSSPDVPGRTNSYHFSSTSEARDATPKDSQKTPLTLETSARTEPAIKVSPKSTSTPIPHRSSSITTAHSSSSKSLQTLTTSQVQFAKTKLTSVKSGSIHSSLETNGNPTSQPVRSVSVNPHSTISLIDISSITARPTATSTVTSLVVDDIFVPIATNAPPPQISTRYDHPVSPLGIQSQQDRFETNKFYGNFYLGGQSCASWTHPYSVTWGLGQYATGSWGLAISHTERDQLGFGPPTSVDAGQWAYFINPIGIQSSVLSATELRKGTTLTTDSLTGFSVNVNLLAPHASSPTITFPLVQGMAFVTAIYTDATPVVQSGVGIINVTYSGTFLDGTGYKYEVSLGDGFAWRVYIVPTSTDYRGDTFTLLNASRIEGPSGFSGYIQVAKIPADTAGAVAVYDGSAGLYATGVSISGSVDRTTGTYSLSWTMAGRASHELLVFALPHHVQSFSSSTASGITDVQLVTTTKGMGTAVIGNTWILVEPDLPISMSFAPWLPDSSAQALSPAAVAAINAAGAVELAEDMVEQTNTGSLYYDGKALAKFAAMIYAIYDIADNVTLALTGLEKLKDCYHFHVNNTMTWPLVYDDVWGGAVSSETYVDGGLLDDFGNTLYNDHHFHYGYFVYAASVIAYLDPAWPEAVVTASNGDSSTNREWVNMLVRDYANPISDDPYYPFSRMFDWYHGHSWAEGLFASADGKNEESSSEDAMSSYAIKMWGKVTNDAAMEARGNMMLAVTARSLHHYFLYRDGNTVEPAEFVGNQVSGILFENKIDHTTYFGDVIAYIEGIHMLPLLPFTSLTRTAVFVQQEAAAYDFSSYVPTVSGGWRGILVGDMAAFDPVGSYRFFSNATGEFNYGFLDGGASLTWYLTWCAALGGDVSSSNGRRETLPAPYDRIVEERLRARFG